MYQQINERTCLKFFFPTFIFRFALSVRFTRLPTPYIVRRLTVEPDWKFTSRIQKGFPISLTVGVPCCLGRFAFQLFNPNGYYEFLCQSFLRQMHYLFRNRIHVKPFEKRGEM